MTRRTFTITADDDGQRLDRWLKKHVPDMPYGLMQKLIRKGAIKIEGKKAKTDARLTEGQEIVIPFDGKTKKPDRLNEKDIAFVKSLVIYEDEYIIALNKPSGLAVQGGTNTLHHLDKLLIGLANDNDVKPRLVHRLDKDTSGVLLLAKTAKIAKALGDMFKHQTIDKTYLALCHTVPEFPDGTIKASLIKAGGLNKERMRVDEDEGKFAATDYVVIDRAGDAISAIAFRPKTGRTHQIRVHAELGGFPIVGDNKYRGEGHETPDMKLADRLHLHAYRLDFTHPINKKPLNLRAPLPAALKKSWQAFGFEVNVKNDVFE